MSANTYRMKVYDYLIAVQSLMRYSLPQVFERIDRRKFSNKPIVAMDGMVGK